MNNTEECIPKEIKQLIKQLEESIERDNKILTTLNLIEEGLNKNENKLKELLNLHLKKKISGTRSNWNI